MDDSCKAFKFTDTQHHESCITLSIETTSFANTRGNIFYTKKGEVLNLTKGDLPHMSKPVFYQEVLCPEKQFKYTSSLVLFGVAVDWCGGCNAHVDFDTVLPLAAPNITYVPGHVSFCQQKLKVESSVSVCFSETGFGVLQVGNGVFLDPATSDEVEIDTTGMSPCILAPPQCTSGATYMFWVKHLNGLGGAILTTMDWDQPREGIKFEMFNDGRFYILVRKYETNSNKFFGHAPGFHVNIDTWQHIVVVWKIDPKLEIYLDREVKTVSQGSNYQGQTYPAPMRMFLGREYVTHTATLTKKIIFDELILFDRPLDADDLFIYFA